MSGAAIIQKGRFELVAGYVRGEWLRNGGLALCMLLFGLGMAIYGLFQTRALLEVARVWRDGIASGAEVDYGGDVVTHYAILKRYDLEVTFQPEADDAPRTFEADFTRFFTGPNEGDPMTVKYDATHAVCSWQYDALGHGWVWAGMIWALASCGVFTFALITRDLVRTTSKVQALAQEGQLMRAQVEEAKHSGTESTPLLVLRYRTARGEGQRQTFFLKHGGPFLIEGGAQVVVLSTFNERDSYALREDGYPLASKPEI